MLDVSRKRFPLTALYARRSTGVNGYSAWNTSEFACSSEPPVPRGVSSSTALRGVAGNSQRGELE